MGIFNKDIDQHIRDLEAGKSVEIPINWFRWFKQQLPPGKWSVSVKGKVITLRKESHESANIHYR